MNKNYLERILKARVYDVAVETPLEPARGLSKRLGNRLLIKREDLQPIFSFKLRGAYNKMASLPPARLKKGVIAASAGNHAQGVALAASLNHVKATIIMPEHASIQKAEATRGYGADVVLHGRDFNEAQEKCFELQRDRGLTLVHAYNDAQIMAGQGTVGLEIVEDLPDVDVVIVGVGGGGLISGIATAIKGKRPNVNVIGVQPVISASLPKSLKAGKIVAATATNTIADGLATKSVGDQTFEVMKRLVDEAVTVTDDEIAHAILLLLERQKNVVEGAGAASLAALLSGRLKVQGKKVVCLISGGNIDINVLDGIILRGLEEAGRIVRFSVTLGDRPGQLRKLLEVVASQRANIRDVVHHRNRMGIPLGQTVVELDVETQGAKHRDQLLVELRKAGYAIGARDRATS